MIINDNIITSRNNETVKWASSLQTKKGRDASRAFIAEGEKLSFEAIEAGLAVSHVFLLESRCDKIMPKLKALMTDDKYADTEIITLSEGAFSKISTENAPQGIISVIKYLDFFKVVDIIYKEEFFAKPNERAIILSSIRDPGNLGAVIRSATAFGVDHIILTADSADLYNPKTVRSAMGSLFRVKATVVTDMRSTIEMLVKNGVRVFSAELDENAASISEIGLSAQDIVVIGNEGHGVDPELSRVCTRSVYIPISKKTESLNAAVAAAIFMWEMGK